MEAGTDQAGAFGRDRVVRLYEPERRALCEREPTQQRIVVLVRDSRAEERSADLREPDGPRVLDDTARMVDPDSDRRRRHPRRFDLLRYARVARLSLSGERAQRGTASQVW